MEGKPKKISENQKLLTPQQKEEIKKAFDFFDITGSGRLELTRNHRSQESEGSVEGPQL